MIGEKMLFAVIGLSAFSLFAAMRPPMDVPEHSRRRRSKD